MDHGIFTVNKLNKARFKIIAYLCLDPKLVVRISEDYHFPVAVKCPGINRFPEPITEQHITYRGFGFKL